MTLNEWNGVDVFLNDDSGAWIHFVSQESMECIDAHQEAVQRNKELELLYMDVYTEKNFELVNPDVKYDYTGRLE